MRSSWTVPATPVEKPVSATATVTPVPSAPTPASHVWYPSVGCPPLMLPAVICAARSPSIEGGNHSSTQYSSGWERIEGRSASATSSMTAWWRSAHWLVETPSSRTTRRAPRARRASMPDSQPGRSNQVRRSVIFSLDPERPLRPAGAL